LSLPLKDKGDKMEHPEYLYGYCRITKEIEKTKIIKVTPKTYKVRNGLLAYGCKTNIPKNDPKIALSPTAAINIFIASTRLRIDSLKSQIANEKNYIEEAEKLL
jgi:hypothetical protein